MDDFQKYLNKQLENEEFRKEYEALEPEYEIMKDLIDSRKDEGITPKGIIDTFRNNPW